MLKFKNFRGKIQEASLKFIIPEDIPVKERNAFMGAAAAAHKAGKSHFDFGGKKHKVTMQGSTARSINSGVTEGYMPSHGDEMKKKMMTTSDKDKLVKIRQMLDREKKPVKKEAKHNNKKKEEKPDIKMNPKQDEVDEARMVKLRGRFNPVVKTDAQKMAKHPMYKGNNSKLERDIRKKHGDKNADHFVIQNIIRKHAEMHEDLNQKDVKTVKKVIKGLKGAVKAHAGQVKSLTKDIQDESVGKTPGDRSYYNLQKAKELAKKAGHDYDKLPQYDRRHNNHKDYFDNKAKNEDTVKKGRPIKGKIGPGRKVGAYGKLEPLPGEPGSIVKGVRVGRPIQGRISKKGVPASDFRARNESKLNELSPKTLSNYARGAAMDMGTKNYVRGFEKGQAMMGMKRKEDPKDKKKAQNRLTGIITATDKLRRKTNEDQHDDDGANHIVMQLRKAVTLRGMRPVTFKDGKKVKVDPSHAQKFLTKYNKAKPMDKEKMQAMAHKSHAHFKKSLDEAVPAIAARAAIGGARAIGGLAKKAAGSAVKRTALSIAKPVIGTAIAKPIAKMAMAKSLAKKKDEDVDEGVLGGIAKAAGYASGILPAYHAARLAGKGVGKMANAALRVKKSDGTRGAIRGTRAAQYQKAQRKKDYYKKQDKLNRDLEKERRDKRQAKSDFRQSKPSLGQRIGGVFASKQPSNEKR